MQSAGSGQCATTVCSEKFRFLKIFGVYSLTKFHYLNRRFLVFKFRLGVLDFISSYEEYFLFLFSISLEGDFSFSFHQ